MNNYMILEVYASHYRAITLYGWGPLFVAPKSESESFD